MYQNNIGTYRLTYVTEAPNLEDDVYYLYHSTGPYIRNIRHAGYSKCDPYMRVLERCMPCHSLLLTICRQGTQLQLR